MYHVGWGRRCAVLVRLDMKNRIREIRESRGLTQQALGDRLDVSYNTIGRWETGVRPFNDLRARQLAKALRCHPGELFSNLPGEPHADSPEGRAIAYVQALPSGQRAAWFQVGASMLESIRKLRPGSMRKVANKKKNGRV